MNHLFLQQAEEIIICAKPFAKFIRQLSLFRLIFEIYIYVLSSREFYFIFLLFILTQLRFLSKHAKIMLIHFLHYSTGFRRILTIFLVSLTKVKGK